MLASNIGVPYEELRPLLDDRWRVAEIDRDETWLLIARYADKRLGEIMAIREQLNSALHRDRVKRVARLAQSNQIGKRRLPRGQAYRHQDV